MTTSRRPRRRRRESSTRPVVDRPAVARQRQVTRHRRRRPSTTDDTTLPPGGLAGQLRHGRRVVYSKRLQRVWTVEEDGTVARPTACRDGSRGTSRCRHLQRVLAVGYTCNIKNPDICWRYMVRFTKGRDGDNIGFHEIPTKNGVPVQTEAQLGQPLSGGCIRQATPDAIYMWNWAPVGTKVVVLAD